MKRRLLVVSLLVLACTAGVRATRAPGKSVTAPGISVTPSSPAPAPHAVEVSRHETEDAPRRAAEPPERNPDTLLARLAAADDYVVLDAADALAARKVTAAIPILAAISLADRPDAAPSVIDAVGRLAGVATGREHDLAVERLGTWLREEKARRAPESAGNVLGLYEALGHTRDPDAVRRLTAELRDPNVTYAAKTVIVDALVRLADPDARASLTAARAEAASAAIDDPFEDEIRRDLLAALDRALASLPT